MNNVPILKDDGTYKVLPSSSAMSVFDVNPAMMLTRYFLLVPDCCGVFPSGGRHICCNRAGFPLAELEYLILLPSPCELLRSFMPMTLIPRLLM